MKTSMHLRRTPFLLLLLAVAILVLGCRPQLPARPARKPASTDDLSLLAPRQIGTGSARSPWVAHVVTLDLDRDGMADVVACEAQENRILWLRQIALGEFVEQVIASDLKAPVHVEGADIDADGDTDLLVASMGYVFPNNDKIGSLFILENDGAQRFRTRAILENVARVNDVRAVDLNQDGKLDLALAQFGFDQGEVRWMERTGPWEFRSHVLLELSGAINVCAADFTGDGRPDLAVLVSQQWEEVYLFENQGGGAFLRKRLWGSTNEDYGSSGMSVCDLNRDGRPDLLFSNGDGFGPAAVPGPRPWHGIQWLENRGQGFFAHHPIGHLDGAYSPVAVDLDNDGDMDVVGVSAFVEKDSGGRQLPSVAWFRNDGTLRFERRVLAYSPQHQIAACVGPLGAGGKTALVTAGFYVFAPPADAGRITLWEQPAQ